MFGRAYFQEGVTRGGSVPKPAGIPPVSCVDSSDGQSARVLTGMSQVRSLLGTPAATQGAT